MKENFERLASDIRRNKLAYGGKGDGEIDPILVSIENKIHEQFPKSKIILNEDYLFLPMYGDGVNDSVDMSRIKSIVNEFYGGLEQADDQSGFIITAPTTSEIMRKLDWGEIGEDQLLTDKALHPLIMQVFDLYLEKDPKGARHLFRIILNKAF